MKVQWNNCFICLNDLGTSDNNGGRNQGKTTSMKKKQDHANATVLMKYLLHPENKKHVDLLQNVLQALKCSQNPGKSSNRRSSTFPISLCEQCDFSTRLVSKLHTQLEVIQMKLVEVIQNVRSTIISNSKSYGSNDLTKACLQTFEELIKVGETAQIPQKGKQILNLLYSFQDAVFEEEKAGPPKIPFVFLKPISSIKASRLQPSSRNQKKKKKDPDVDLDPVVVKIESVILPPVPPVDDFMEYYSPAPPDDDIDNMDFLPTDISVFKEEPSAPKTLRASTRIRNRPELQKPAEFKKPRKKYQRRTEEEIQRKKERKRKYQLTLHPKTKQFKKGRGTKKVNDHFYNCATCSFSIARAAKFEHHLRLHESPDKVHSCPHCDQWFSGKQLFEYHLTLHTGGTHLKTCDFEGCRDRVPNVELPDHIRKKHNTDKVFMCQCCSFSSATRAKYIVHLRLHGEHNLICDVCSEKFKSRQKFFSHLYEIHKVIDKVKCPFDNCEKFFLDPYNLDAHKLKHRNLEICVCSECNQGFHSRSSYHSHMKMHSSGKEPSYSCDLCTESFLTRFALENHKQKDHDAPRVICIHCQKEFPDYRKLLSHITKNHEGARYPCMYCDQTFGTTTSWRRHQYTHSAGNTFVCEECGKVFTSKGNWSAHMKIHSEVKKYKCSYCPKAFAVLKYLKDHTRTHTGERPFMCPDCGKAFSQQGSLLLHKRKVHNEVKTKPISVMNNASGSSEGLEEFKYMGGPFVNVIPK